MAPICIFSVFSVQYSVYSVFCIFSVQCILTSLLRSCVSRAPASILLTTNNIDSPLMCAQCLRVGDGQMRGCVASRMRGCACALGWRPGSYVRHTRGGGGGAQLAASGCLLIASHTQQQQQEEGAGGVLC
jgi:hypothetical protein